jgi:beta-xylosidase
MIRVGDTYYMSSTTMHMSPGVPIMKSEDLVNWEIVNYAYQILPVIKRDGIPKALMCGW